MDTKSRNSAENIDEFLADLAHEFQTPIAILKGNLEILAQGKNKKKRRAAQIAQRTLDQLSRLVQNMLTTARVRANRNAPRFEPFDIGILIKEVREDCATLARYKRIRFNASLEEREAPLRISGDRDQLREVLLNLISNAMKHTPRGGTVSLIAHPANIPDTIEIIVADTGAGIALQVLPHIFERYYTIHPSQGTGLGLYLCRQIIEAHGGIITAESKPGQGARFTIRLPRAPSLKLQPATIETPDGIIKQ